VVVRLIARRDVSLVSSLIISTIVLFNRPLKTLFDVAAEVENRYGLDLLSALALLGITSAFHEYRKFREVKEEVARSRVRAAEVERLLSIGKGLAGALDYQSLQQTLHRFLPSFCGERGYWLLRRNDRQWLECLQDASTSDDSAADHIDIATQAVTLHREPNDVNGVEVNGHSCHCLKAGDMLIGVLGVRNTPPLGAEERRAISAAGTLIALALRTAQTLHESQQRGMLDDLTRCMTRAAGLPRLKSELRRARRTGQPISLLVLDIDNFKSNNDSYGHLCGDQVLANLGALLDRLLRASDIRCRMGGDEFLIVLPETSAEGAAQVAEKLRVGVSASIDGADGAPPITISIGGVTAADGEGDSTVLIGLADRALYQSKRAGRNRWHFAGGRTAPSTAALSAVAS
jgi:diguanylate cyclase (GGDEF)-like protein